MQFTIAEMQRLLQNLIGIGTVADVDHETQKVRLKDGDMTTNWLDWPAEYGRNYVRWRPIHKGQQFIYVAESGDPSQAKIIGEIYTQAIQPPTTDPDVDITQYNNGAFIRHNIKTNELALHSVGDLILTAGQNVVIGAGENVDIDGVMIYLN